MYTKDKGIKRRRTVKKNTKAILICVLVLIVVLILIVVNMFLNRVTMNPEGTIGNTAGNLNNGGLFCEYDGYVYFSNVNDDGSLYRMRPDESEKEKLLDVQPGNILAGGDYLYYFQYGVSGEMGLGNIRSSHDFHRADLDGDNIVSLETDVVVTGQLVDNYLYLLIAGDKHPTFRKVKIDKSERIDLAQYVVNPACAKDGLIYYNGTEKDHYLYTLNTSNHGITELWAGDIWFPTIDGDYIYFIDVAKDYRLCRYVMSSEIIEVLTEERIECFNVGNGYVYYQVASETNPMLKMMSTDGSNVTTIAEGDFTNINMTSRYVYFQKFDEEDTMYHSPIGSTTYSSM